MPFPLVSLRQVDAWGQLARLAAVLLAFLPLLVVVLCAVPALVVGHFVPSMRRPTAELMHGFNHWTTDILSVVTTVSANPQLEVPRQRDHAADHDGGELGER